MAVGWLAKLPSGKPSRTLKTQSIRLRRFMGRRYDEVTEEIRQVPYKVQAAGGDVRIAAGGKEWSPPEISAIILQKMKQSAEDYSRDTRSIRPYSRFRVLQRFPAAGYQGRR
jgi:hypothetical protein